jgi:ElaB/YqjD/DUF883 family membrane-anchored ribosome-binding protein
MNLEGLNNNMENIMETPTNSEKIDFGTLAEDARALMAATADVAGEKVIEARKRLAVALENSREVCGRVRDRAVNGARVVDAKVQGHPYEAMAIAGFAGFIIGCLLTRRQSCTNSVTD